MSKRNFILLIIILCLMTITIFIFYYFRTETTAPEEGKGTNFVSQFNPFGSGKNTPSSTTTGGTDVSEYQPNSGENKSEMKLEKVSSMPIAGFTVFIKERLKEIILAPLLTEGGAGSGDSSTTPPSPSTTPLQKEGTKTKPTPPPTEFVPALRYVDKVTGNIYQTFADKTEERKFSTTIIPKVYEAFFGNKGESVVIRYLKEDERTIETFVGILPKELFGGDTTENNEIKGSFLPNNVQDVSISPDKTKIFYLFESGDSMIGTILNLLNDKKIQIFNSAFTEWLSFWPNINTITLTTKPSASVPGYMYTTDSAGKNFTEILGNLNGLTTLGSPNGKLILYGSNDSLNNPSMYVYHTDSRNSNTLGIRTLPEKCIWGKANDIIYCAVPKSIAVGDYPDTWYQGEVSFNDQFWKIDVETGNTTLILDPITIVGGEEIDGIKLALDESENYLFFVNKKDSFLWKLKLK